MPFIFLSVRPDWSAVSHQRAMNTLLCYMSLGMTTTHFQEALHPACQQHIFLETALLGAFWTKSKPSVRALGTSRAGL